MVSTDTRAPKVNAEVEKQQQPRKITEKELKLEPLCNEVHKTLNSLYQSISIVSCSFIFL
jgi:hypothetical protein